MNPRHDDTVEIDDLIDLLTRLEPNSTAWSNHGEDKSSPSSFSSLVTHHGRKRADYPQVAVSWLDKLEPDKQFQEHLRQLKRHVLFPVESFVNYWSEPVKLPECLVEALCEIDLIIKAIVTPEDHDRALGVNGLVEQIIYRPIDDQQPMHIYDNNAQRHVLQEVYNLKDLILSLECEIYQCHPSMQKLIFLHDIALEYSNLFEFKWNTLPASPVNPLKLTQLSEFAQHYHFRSVSISSKFFEQGLAILTQGATTIESFYGLEPHHVGAATLSLNINPQRHYGYAGYEHYPQGLRRISFFSLNDQSVSHFVHEFTHCMQFAALGLKDMDSMPADAMNGIMGWDKLSEKLSLTCPERDEIHLLLTDVLKSQCTLHGIAASSTQIDNFASHCLESKRHAIHFKEFLGSMVHMDPLWKTLPGGADLQDLMDIHDAWSGSQTRGFERKLWLRMDDTYKVPGMEAYLNHSLEVHARIAESFAFSSRVNNGWYLLESTKAGISELFSDVTQNLRTRYLEALACERNIEAWPCHTTHDTIAHTINSDIPHNSHQPQDFKEFKISPEVRDDASAISTPSPSTQRVASQIAHLRELGDISRIAPKRP